MDVIKIVGLKYATLHGVNLMKIAAVFTEST